MSTQPATDPLSISPLLQGLASPEPSRRQHVSTLDIAAAFALIFENRISHTQMAVFLALLHSTGLDREPEVIALCAEKMRDAAVQVDRDALNRVLEGREGLGEGRYHGGLCDIVGTGGDSHKTFNISTASSIIASPLLMIAKHGNRASTSLSGSADVLGAIKPVPPTLTSITANNLAKVYGESNYAFLFAPNFHRGMAHAAPVRKELGLRTIFNLLGPLANPIEWAIEARLLGVASQSLGPVFAQVLKMGGIKKAMVVCGAEDLDEISCAGKTNCWMISGGDGKSENDNGDEDGGDTSSNATIEAFSLEPADFGLSTHPLSEVGGGKLPDENAEILMSILANQRPHDDPITEFVLLNVAALLVVSGVCEADTSNMGPGDDGHVIKERGPGGGRWKEGVRRARWAIESGRTLESLQKYIGLSNQLSE